MKQARIITQMTGLMLVMFFSCIAQAESADGPGKDLATDIKAYTSLVLSLNEIDPLQNPTIETAGKMIGRRFLDKNRQTLGHVSDMVFSANGKIESVTANMDSMSFAQDMTFDSVAYNLATEDGAFTVSLARDQIEGNLPKFLAETAPAAGQDNAVTLTSLIGANVVQADGAIIGQVSDVLIRPQKNKAAGEVSGLLIHVLTGRAAGKNIAVPYIGHDVTRTGDKARLGVSEAQADVIESYAK